MENARIGPDDPVSESASIRLSNLRRSGASRRSLSVDSVRNMLPSQSYNPFAHRAFDDLSINESFATTETHRIEAESILDQAADASSTHGSFNTALTQQSTERLGLDRNEHESNSSWVGGSPQTRHLVAQQLISGNKTLLYQDRISKWSLNLNLVRYKKQTQVRNQRSLSRV